MDIADTWKRIEALPALMRGILDKEQSALNELDALWFITTGNHLKPGCRDCRIRAYQEVTSFTYEKLIQMSTQKFKLKPVSLIYFGHQHYTDKTITDEVAVAMLQSNPDNISKFAEYPSKDGKVVLDLPADTALSDEQKASVFKKGNFFYYTNEAGEEVKTSKKFLTDNGVDPDTVTEKQ